MIKETNNLKKKKSLNNKINNLNKKDEELCSNPEYNNDKDINDGIKYKNKEIVIGWENSYQVAEDIWGSIHQRLLSGKLIFAYKTNNKSSDLIQVVIVLNNDKSFSIGLITTKYSMLLPNMPKEYLSEVLYNDLKTFKIDKEILTIFEQIIQEL